ncbi:ferritin [Elizabethkingia anophelis]|uniref:Ferritin n=1 Tax=Elizabethkingia anophelis TaxID=1117645 RepID=A0A7Z7LXC1_9FLAO|nr:ferritin [Elizabethkingia anophelis]MCT3629440.1 ferritin [Elizabethkingia anophelis]MCT3632713.1 ferritin [Elizabethkingia anophelis]MCT3744741.1 ferritin [Elizabethkingia anophelis]MCT3829684.1 ferritin [Elizabethkingia anophelis]MCT3833734.1 ferritin [Elizabethkingia anophelis]
MISTKVESLINEQIAKEQYAAQYYLAMSAWFENQDLEGLANYFRVQSKEELMHADKMFDYLNDVGGKVILQTIPAPPSEFADALDIFEKALAHEKEVTKSIFNIVKVATEENDFATTSFLQWFINEQVEEEATASQYVSKIKMVKDNPSALYLFDQELGQRVFTADAEA